MREYIALLLILLGLSVSAQDKRPFTIYDYLKLKTVGQAVLSPDGHNMAFTINIKRPVEDGKGNNYKELYIKNTETETIIPILTGKQNFSSVQWTPDSKFITCLAKFNEISNNQVFKISINTRESVQVTDISGGIKQYAWNPQGKGLAYTTVEKKSINEDLKQMGFDAEIYEEDIPDIKLHWLYEGGSEKLNQKGTVFDFAWSPDGNKIAAQIAPRNLIDHKYMFKKLYLIDLENGTQQLLVDNPGKLTNMAWSPDSKHLAFIAGVDSSDPVSGSLFAVEVPNEKGWEKIKNYTVGFYGSVSDVKWKDNRTLIFSADESVNATLSEIRLGDTLRKLISGNYEQIVFDDFYLVNGRIIMVANTPAHPDELYSFNIRKKTFTRETISNPWLADLLLARQEKVSYNARDGLTIEGVLQFPINYEKGYKYPLICMIHGGPESCIMNGWTTSYSKWGNIAASQGYFVFMPNYRASSGRGVTYSKMDHKDLGDEEFQDVIDGIEYLAAKGYIDKGKVGIGGGSYGGYFSALGATKYSEHFAAAIPFVSVTNQLSKVNLTDIPNEIYQVHWTIWPNDDPQLFYDRSPVKYSSNNKTPTLILHGKEDTRVHPSQSLELYRQLKLHGNAPVRLIWYPGEGHGNKNTQSQLDFNLRTMRWFNYYLKGEGDPEELPPIEINYQLEKLSDTTLDLKPKP
jgi:dipeptidyl aminopeptidase/acylaminoacyl peptidase